MGIYRTKKNGETFWRYDIYVAGRRVRTPRGIYFPTKEECIDAVSAVRTDHRRGEYRFPADRSTIKLADLRDAWTNKQLHQLNRDPKFVSRVKQVLTDFEKATHCIYVEDVETAAIEKYHLSRTKKGLKAISASIEMSMILTALNNAPSLFTELKDWRPPLRPKGIVCTVEGRERVITQDEERVIIEGIMLESDPLVKQDARIFWFALRTGMRKGEILGLLKTSVIFERAIRMEFGWIDVRRQRKAEHTKNRKKRIIPLSRTVAEMLRDQIKNTDRSCPWVFPGKYGGQRSDDSLMNSLSTACERAGIPYGDSKAGGVVFHDTRHTATTRMLQSGIDIKTVGTILGHSDAYMTMRYAHATAATRQAAVAALEDESFRVRFESTAETFEATSDRVGPRTLKAKQSY